MKGLKMNTDNIIAALNYLLDSEQGNYAEHLANEGEPSDHIYHVATQAKAEIYALLDEYREG